jgi:predicted transposase/invertase (TIGR01784 family)
VDIELQVVNYHDFRKRGPFYWALRHTRKLKSGMIYTEIKPTITICLLAFDLLEEEEAYRNSYSIRNDKSGNCLCQDMKIIYLELPKFRRHLGDRHVQTGLERWLLYFSNEEGERMDKAAAENPVFSTVKEIESIFWADKKERDQYFAYQRMLMDAYSAEHTHEYLMAEAQKKAEEAAKKAREEGEKEGRKEEKEKVARSMLAKGISIAIIAECTELDEKTIRSLK